MDEVDALNTSISDTLRHAHSQVLLMLNQNGVDDYLASQILRSLSDVRYMVEQTLSRLANYHRPPNQVPTTYLVQAQMLQAISNKLDALGRLTATDHGLLVDVFDSIGTPTALTENDRQLLTGIQDSLNEVLDKEQTIMATQAELDASIAQLQTDVSGHLDALDTSISAEIANAQAAIQAAVAAGGTPAEIAQASLDALNAMDTSLGAHVDNAKASLDAAFPAPAVTPAPAPTTGGRQP